MNTTTNEGAAVAGGASNKKRIPAKQLRAGMSLVERDGALLTIQRVERNADGSVTVTTDGFWMVKPDPITWAADRMVSVFCLDDGEVVS